MIHNLSNLIYLLTQQIVSSDFKLSNYQSFINQYNGYDWIQYQDNMIKDKGYNKTLINQNDFFELYLISWLPNNSSLIHNHQDNGCVFKVLEGELNENIFLEDQKTCVTSKNILSNQTSYIDNQIGYHQIKNPNNYFCYSLHLYPPSTKLINK